MNKPIRVLHILQRMEAGGTQALVMNNYRKIDRTKVQFDFFVEYPNKQFYDDEIVRLGGKIYYNSVRVDGNIRKFQKNLANILKTGQYKIVHVHTYSIGYFVLKTAKKCGVPIRIVHSHNNETVHDSKYFLKLILQKLYPIYATDFISCSTDAGKYLFKNREFDVLKNSIDSEKFIFSQGIRDKVRCELGVSDNFVVGHIGRLHQQKNHQFLLQVFAEIKKKKPNAILLLVGEGPLKNEIIAQVKKLGLEDSVKFLGNRKDVSCLDQAFDVFVLPSLFEGLGIVAVEAQAAGLPVLCSTGVSKDAKISPIFHYLSLDKTPTIWADKAIKISKDKLAHTNMQSYVIESGYDVSDTARWLQQYYLDKYQLAK
ncbi:glycosyltransferase family 1 protein [Lactobacillus delbrueckii]|uniref:glycosyltransferase family 1 protein n=1 Tax=Lactobacillus delbrueckii TaxID=1584 RepID=UPI00073956C9|nr:glycosyltransferase family 1 protein [Lactobacillus delbrueckii]CUS16842.1 Glycosyltransferase [Lactobacillus delbrueckii subsp. bulgaricus]